VTKPFSHRQLAARLRAIMNRAVGGLAPELDQELVAEPLRLDSRSHEVTVGGERTVRLTPLEFKVLRVLAINAGQVVSPNLIVERAWGYEGGEASMVKTHVSHIRRKLGVPEGQPGSIRTVPWVGYALVRS
jgi:DNA-binding response OmpR family regulator